jgi:hypothetical protein
MGLWELAAWMMASVVKFVITPSLMVARGIPAWEVVGVTSLGAAFGVLVFFRFGKWLFRKWSKLTASRDKPRKVFTPGRRRIVWLRHRFGLFGLLLISGLISVPIASLLGAKYYPHYRSMPWSLMLAFAAWSVALTFLSWWVRSGVTAEVGNL